MKLLSTVVVSGLGVAAYVVGLLADAPELAAAGILVVWLVRQVAASQRLRDGSVSWGRLRTHLWRANTGMQYALRAMAFLLILVETGSFSPGQYLLAALACMATLLGCYLLPAVQTAAFSLHMDAIGVPGYEAAGDHLTLFDGTNVKFRKLLVALRAPVRWLEGAILLTLVAVGDRSDETLVVVLSIQLALAAVCVLAVSLTACLDVLRKNFATKEAALVEGVIDAGAEIVLYFSASSPESLYQPAQWLGALRATGRPLMVITREAMLLEPLADLARCPVVWVRDLSDLERVVPESAKVACYVNNGVKNGHFLRLEGLVHIQLLHGESDKASSTAKTTRAFDRVFVAGQAAIDRYEAAGTEIPAHRFAIVGRPVTDAIEPAGEPGPERTVLYAPTWEGFDAASNWTSLGEISMAILRELRRREDLTVVFKPHPLTGSTNARYQAALAEVEAFISADPRGRDLYLPPDSDADLYELFNRSSCLVTDLSSVLADYLKSGKPMLVCDPKGMGAEHIHREYPTTVGSYVVDADTEALAVALDDALGPDPLAERRAATAGYVLGDFEGSSTQRFAEAIEAVFKDLGRRQSLEV